MASHGTDSYLEQVVRQYRKVYGRLDKAVEQEQDNKRQLLYYQDDKGMWIIHALLPPEAGCLVVKTVEAEAASEQLEAQNRRQSDRHSKQTAEHDSAESTDNALRAIAPGVDERTAATQSRGEDCDHDMAIDALLLRDGGGGCRGTTQPPERQAP